MNPLDTLESDFAEVVGQMSQNMFDSHAFILMLAKAPPRQRIYVQALAETAGDDPHRQVHGQISKRLGKHTELVISRGKVTSNNIFGDPSSNELWERR